MGDPSLLTVEFFSRPTPSALSDLTFHLNHEANHLGHQVETILRSCHPYSFQYIAWLECQYTYFVPEIAAMDLIMPITRFTLAWTNILVARFAV